MPKLDLQFKNRPYFLLCVAILLAVIWLWTNISTFYPEKVDNTAVTKNNIALSNNSTEAAKDLNSKAAEEGKDKQIEVDTIKSSTSNIDREISKWNALF